jgi:hypothetical protein
MAGGVDFLRPGHPFGRDGVRPKKIVVFSEIPKSQKPALAEPDSAALCRAKTAGASGDQARKILSTTCCVPGRIKAFEDAARRSLPTPATRM